MNLIEHLVRQQHFSVETFGPGTRQKGVVDHIKKELKEIAEGDNDPKEWVDVVLLAFDGLWRSIRDRRPEMTETQIAGLICGMIAEKQQVNEGRDWPDWRTMSPDHAIEHDRSGETQ